MYKKGSLEGRRWRELNYCNGEQIIKDYTKCFDKMAGLSQNDKRKFYQIEKGSNNPIPLRWKTRMSEQLSTQWHNSMCKLIHCHSYKNLNTQVWKTVETCLRKKIDNYNWNTQTRPDYPISHMNNVNEAIKYGTLIEIKHLLANWSIIGEHVWSEAVNYLMPKMNWTNFGNWRKSVSYRVMITYQALGGGHTSARQNILHFVSHW